MENIIKLSVKEREDLFRETAARDGRFNALIVEKDFWVCWTLKILFELPELSDFLIFKGGTSLSKVYGAIERFSEDIDLSISREFFGFTGDNDPANPNISGKKRKKLLDKTLPEKVEHYIKSNLIVKLDNLISQNLNNISNFSLSIADDDKQTILFKYPTGINHELDYIKQYVRIELGVRSDHWPKEKATVSPYIADYFPELFRNSICKVDCLSVNRTFWEKITLLHSLAHKPKDKKLSTRSSRHYYDTYMLLKQSSRLNIDINNTELLAAVRKHKMLFYKSSWAKYDLAVKGTLKLIPPDFRLPEINEDYRLTTRDMIFGDVPSLETVINTLQIFQQNFNG